MTGQPLCGPHDEAAQAAADAVYHRRMAADDWEAAYEGASANGARLGEENARLRAQIAAAQAELEAFADSPMPAEVVAGAAVLAVHGVTVPFIGRMRAALGGAE